MVSEGGRSREGAIGINHVESAISCLLVLLLRLMANPTTARSGVGKSKIGAIARELMMKRARSLIVF